MIELVGVTKEYGKKDSLVTALRDVTLQIEDASTVAIIGKSGSGKSTLMHIMSGLDRPTSGTVSVDGQNLATMKAKAMDSFRARQMSFIFQSFFVEANQTCAQNVMLPLEIARVPITKRSQLIKDALAAVDLSDKSGQLAGNLSGGQKQRLAIARAIVNKPRILFVDEPTGNLDSVTGDKIMQLLFDLNKDLGCTLILVTHDAELAGRCSQQIRLHDGMVVEITKSKQKQGAK